jgi:hypothetical protein
MAGVSLAQQALHHVQHRARVGTRGLLLALHGSERACGQGDRRVRPLRRAALLATRCNLPGAQEREELSRRAGGGRFGEGTPDVNPRVVV